MNTRRVWSVATLATVIGITSLAMSLTPSASAPGFRFSDGSRAESALACANRGMFAQYQEFHWTSDPGVWMRMRLYSYFAYGQYVNAWTPWTAWAQLLADSTSGAMTNDSRDLGAFSVEVQYAKSIGGRYEHRRQYMKVEQFGTFSALDALAIINTQATTVVCSLTSGVVITRARP